MTNFAKYNKWEFNVYLLNIGKEENGKLSDIDPETG